MLKLCLKSLFPWVVPNAQLFLHLVTGGACDKNGSSTSMHRQSVSALFLELSFDSWKMLAEAKSSF